MPRVAVVTVTYNSEKYLSDYFESLKKVDRGDLEVEVFIVDGASTDGTLGELKKRDDIRLTASDKNIGFAGGNNVAVQEALDEGFDYVYLLNPDTIVDPNFLVEAVKVAESDPKIGSVQSLMLLWPDTDRVNSIGNIVHFLGFGYSRGYRQLRSSVGSEVRDIAYASGAAVLYRASALEETGLFDERFFMYHEDLELGWRMRLAGYRNVLAPGSVIWHKYEFSRSIKKYFWMERNRYAFLFRNCAPWTLIVLSPWLFASEVASFAISIVRGWWREKLRAYRELAFSDEFWISVLEGREEMNRMRKVSDRKLFSSCVAVITYQEVDSWFVSNVANPLMNGVWKVVKKLL